MLALLVALRGFHQHDLLNLILTPCDLEKPEWSHELDDIEFGEEYDEFRGMKSVGIHCGNTWTSTSAEIPTTFDFFRMIGHELTELEVSHLQSIWHILGAHRALSRDVFLTDDAMLIKYRTSIGANLSIWILTIEEALDYCETTWKAEGTYRLAHFTTTDRSTYYAYRVEDLAPSIGSLTTRLWSNRESYPEVLEYLASIRDRLGYLLEAHDSIGACYYTPSELDVTDSMLYHLNYFMLLATATLDNVAWALKGLFSVE